MNYLPSQEFQLRGFLYSLVLGFALSVIYDLLKLFFYLLTFRKTKLTNLRDVVFFVISLFATFIYLLVMCEGQILFYALFGEAAGFFAHRFTVGRYIFGFVFGKLPRLNIKSTLKNKTNKKDEKKFSEILKKIQKKT